MSVLVTGGAGFIGSHTCVELLEAGHDVIVADNFYNSKPESLNRVREITGKEVKLCECDIRDESALDRIFAGNTIDSVIHFAGLKAVGESIEKPIEYYDNNIGGTLKLCAAMKKAGCKRMVFSSSATVYGAGNESPLREDMKPGETTNPYGTTKLYIERILSDVCVSDPEWSVVLLRYFNPVGAHKSGLIGENPNGIPNNIMPRISEVACGKMKYIGVFGDDYDTPDGSCLRDYIHVVDLAKGHIKALEKAQNIKGCEIYNLGTGRGVSVFELIAAFERASGRQIPTKIMSRRPGDLAAVYSDSSKAQRELGWHAQYTVDDMCADNWNWLARNPNGF